jgi:hypothetical protein
MKRNLSVFSNILIAALAEAVGIGKEINDFFVWHTII